MSSVDDSEPARQADDVWTIGRILTWTKSFFDSKGIESSRLDAEILLASVLQVKRIYLYTHYDKPLSQSERDAFRALVRRRSRLEPVAYILGQREFYGREFTVDKTVLVPRPETEHLIDAVLQWLKAHAIAAPRIIDIGTGSGAIACTLALECKASSLVATDISEAALQTARINADRLGCNAQIEWRQGDLFATLRDDDRFDIIVSNPPYIGTDEVVMPDVVQHEPHSALFAGRDGLSVIERLCSEASLYLKRPGLLAIEIGSSQGEKVCRLLSKSGKWHEPKVLQDLAQLDRIVTVEPL